MERVRCEVASPIDPLTLIAEGDALVGVRFADGSGRRWFRGDQEIEIDDAHPVLVRARQQLTEYFAGAREAFDLPLQTVGRRVPAAGLGRAAARSRTATRSATATWPLDSAIGGWRSRSVRPWVRTHCRSSSRAIGWSVATGR